jgi:hypothetical protein
MTDLDLSKALRAICLALSEERGLSELRRSDLINAAKRLTPDTASDRDASLKDTKA